MAPATARHPLLPLLANLTLSLAVCLATLTLADLVVGPHLFPSPLRAGDPNLPHDIHVPAEVIPPPRAIQLSGFYSVPGANLYGVPINALGYAGTPPPLPAVPGRMRVLTLGGSAFFNRNIADRLDSALGEADVLGGALQGHTTRASLLKFNALHQLGYEGENAFDVVFVYHAINDLWANHVPAAQFRADYSHLDPWYTRNALLDHSLLARKAYNSWVYPRTVGGGGRGYPAPADENGSAFASEPVFAANLRALVAAIRASGSTPVLLTFATYLPPDYSYEKFRAHALGYVNPEEYDQTPVEMWGSPAFVREGIRRHNAVIRAVARESGTTLLDIEAEFAGQPALFGDVCHLSEQGTARLVERLAAFLTPPAPATPH